MTQIVEKCPLMLLKNLANKFLNPDAPPGPYVTDAKGVSPRELCPDHLSSSPSHPSQPLSPDSKIQSVSRDQ